MTKHFSPSNKKRLVPSNYETIYVPENFDAELLLKKNHDDSGLIKADKLNYLVSLIYEEMNPETGFAILKAIYLRNKIRHYKEHMDYLKSTHVIPKISPYEVGVTSFGYSLSEEYQTSLKELKIDSSIFVSKSVRKPKSVKGVKKKNSSKKTKVFVVESITTNVLQDPNYSHLKKWFNKKLRIDYDEAERWVKSDISLYAERRAVRINQILSVARKIYEMKFENLTIDNYGGRYYSPLTSLKSGLKIFLTYDGKSLESIDIKSSLPYILGVIMVSNNKELEEISNRIIGKYNKGKKKDITIMMHTLRQSLDMVEVEGYLQLLQGNGIYEEFARKLVEKDKDFLLKIKVNDDKINRSVFLKKILLEKDRTILNDMDKYNTKAAKSLFVKILSAKMSKEEYYKVFKELFPTISQFLERLKNIGDASDKHKCSSHILQSLESYIVLHLISKEFVEKYREPIFTIHDNMITTESNLNKLRELAYEVFSRFSDYPPQFNEEKYIVKAKAA